MYQSVVHDGSDVSFGIDLRQWSENGWNLEQATASGSSGFDCTFGCFNSRVPRLTNDTGDSESPIYPPP
jgi:hypothetical protein